jgi:hypothetical protein
MITSLNERVATFSENARARQAVQRLQDDLIAQERKLADVKTLVFGDSACLRLPLSLEKLRLARGTHQLLNAEERAIGRLPLPWPFSRGSHPGGYPPLTQGGQAERNSRVSGKGRSAGCPAVNYWEVRKCGSRWMRCRAVSLLTEVAFRYPQAPRRIARQNRKSVG